MASFMASLFSNSKAQDRQDTTQRPTTPNTNPNRNSFVTPSITPQGSPSKKTAPPGAHDLPVAFDNLKLSTNPFDPPVKFDPSALSTHLSPGKINNNTINIFEDSPASAADESIIQKPSAAASPRKHGQENTPPVSSRPPIVDSPSYISHAAVSRQGLYQQTGRERPSTPAKKFNTSRGLTAEERELLQKPNVKRLVNVTQLCRFLYPPGCV
jgi:cell cycle protein kinase DBF2